MFIVTPVFIHYMTSNCLMCSAIDEKFVVKSHACLMKHAKLAFKLLSASLRKLNSFLNINTQN